MEDNTGQHEKEKPKAYRGKKRVSKEMTPSEILLLSAELESLAIALKSITVDMQAANIATTLVPTAPFADAFESIDAAIGKVQRRIKKGTRKLASNRARADLLADLLKNPD